MAWPFNFRGSSPPRTLRPLAPQRRLLCALLILVGLSTFVLPTITTELPLHGSSQWSPLVILRQIEAGTLPVDNRYSAEPWWPVEFDLGASYLLLVVALLAVVVFPSPGLLAALAALDLLFALGIGGRRDNYAWGELFYDLPNRLHFYRWGATVEGVHLSYPLMLGAVDALILGILYVNQNELIATPEPLPDEPSSEELDGILAADPKHGGLKYPSEN